MRDANELLDDLDLVVFESNIPVIEGGTSSATLPTSSQPSLSISSVTYSVTVEPSRTQTLD